MLLLTFCNKILPNHLPLKCSRLHVDMCGLMINAEYMLRIIGQTVCHVIMSSVHAETHPDGKKKPSNEIIMNIVWLVRM